MQQLTTYSRMKTSEGAACFITLAKVTYLLSNSNININVNINACEEASTNTNIENK